VGRGVLHDGKDRLRRGLKHDATSAMTWQTCAGGHPDPHAPALTGRKNTKYPRL
jgi:hypothetical protein